MESFAETLEDSNICMIHRDKMQRLMEQYPTIALKILEQFSKRLDTTERLVGDLRSQDVEASIARYLLELR